VVQGGETEGAKNMQEESDTREARETVQRGYANQIGEAQAVR
jgi:hypothetical protein